jgi:hypothetical protein
VGSGFAFAFLGVAGSYSVFQPGPFTASLAQGALVVRLYYVVASCVVVATIQLR